MIDASSLDPSSSSQTMEGIMGNEVISVLCDGVRDATEHAMQDAVLNALLKFYTQEVASPSSSAEDPEVTKVAITSHTAINIIEHSRKPTEPSSTISLNESLDSENLNKVPTTTAAITKPASIKIVEKSGRLTSSTSTKPEVVHAIPVSHPDSQQSLTKKPSSVPSKNFTVASSKPTLSHNSNIVIPCESGALRSNTSSRNVQHAGGSARPKNRLITEVVLLPSSRSDADIVYRRVKETDPIIQVPPQHEKASIPQPSSTKADGLNKDSVESSTCEISTYSNQSSFRKEVSIQRKQGPKPQSQPPQFPILTSTRRSEQPPDEVNHRVISLPNAHQYNSPRLLSSKLPKKVPALETSSISSTDSHAPINQSTPKTTELPLERPNQPTVQNTHKVECAPPVQTALNTSIDPGEVWPRYDDEYANYLRHIGKGMGPWDGNLDTTWDLSTINYSLYDDEPGQLPLNIANPKYLTPPAAEHQQGYTIPWGYPPPGSSGPLVHNYEYEEGECLPNGAIPDECAVHYFKHGYYMGSGQASNNYQAVNNVGVAYDYNNQNQRYLNGILYREQYENYMAKNPYSKSAIDCGREYYFQQQYKEQHMRNLVVQDQYPAHYLQNLYDIGSQNSKSTT